MAFDAASVKVSPPIDRTRPLEMNGCKGGPGTSDPGLFACSRITLQSLVIRAFGIASYQYPYVPSGDHTTYEEIIGESSASRRPHRLLVRQAPEE